MFKYFLYLFTNYYIYADPYSYIKLESDFNILIKELEIKSEVLSTTQKEFLSMKAPLIHEDTLTTTSCVDDLKVVVSADDMKYSCVDGLNSKDLGLTKRARTDRGAEESTESDVQIKPFRWQQKPLVVPQAQIQVQDNVRTSIHKTGCIVCGDAPFGLMVIYAY